MAQKNEIQETARIDALFEKVSALINQARKHVATTINVAEVGLKKRLSCADVSLWFIQIR